MNPLDLIKNAYALLTDAITAVPAVKYALGVVGIAAAAAIAGALLGGYGRQAIVVVALLFLGMILLLVFARLATGEDTHLAGQVLLWATVAFFLVFMGFTALAAWNGSPCNWADFLGFQSKCSRTENLVGCFDKPFEPSPMGDSRPKLPNNTGWIWAGYVENRDLQWKWIEGPFLLLSSGELPKASPTIAFQKGDAVITRGDRPVVMVDFRNRGDCEWETSPISIPGGKLRPEDQTGITLPTGTRLTVRDVTPNHFSNNPTWVIWLRVAYDTLQEAS